jgi:hypothetical protein
MLSDTNAAAVRSAGCSWTAWKDAQDVGGFEMFAGRSRMGRPNIAVLMVRDAQCVRLPKAASICVASNASFEIEGTLATLHLKRGACYPVRFRDNGSSWRAAMTTGFCIQLHLEDNVERC